MSTKLGMDRVVKIPLEIPDKETMKELRQLALLCSQFGNHLLTEQYAKAKGLDGLTPYTDYNQLLSSYVRDAIHRECVGVWRRLGKNILSGRETLARFSRYRAIVIRDRGIAIENPSYSNGDKDNEDDGKICFYLRLKPAKTDKAHRLFVYMPALKRDKYLNELLHKLTRHIYPITKATLAFERFSNKIFLFVSYKKISSEEKKQENIIASIGPYGEDGTLYLRCNNNYLSLTDQIYRLGQVKMHFGGIHGRLRQCLNKRGRRYNHRKALAKAGSFDKWAIGPLHEMSHQIITWCVKRKVSELHWKVQSEADLPWDRLSHMIKYKAEEVNIAFSQTIKKDEQKNHLRKKRKGKKTKESIDKE